MKSSHFYEDVREKRFLSLRDRWTDGRIGCNTLCGAYRDRHITTSRIGNTSKSLRHLSVWHIWKICHFWKKTVRCAGRYA